MTSLFKFWVVLHRTESDPTSISKWTWLRTTLEISKKTILATVSSELMIKHTYFLILFKVYLINQFILIRRIPVIKFCKLRGPCHQKPPRGDSRISLESVVMYKRDLWMLYNDRMSQNNSISIHLQVGVSRIRVNMHYVKLHLYQ